MAFSKCLPNQLEAEPEEIILASFEESELGTRVWRSRGLGLWSCGHLRVKICPKLEQDSAPEGLENPELGVKGGRGSDRTCY